MKKLIQGIVDFRVHVLPHYRTTFAKLAEGQQPDALFVACSDSRVVPNVFASTNPGDLFVVRNVGNFMPPSSPAGLSVGDESEPAAIEFAVNSLKVKDIIVCGHSECGAMMALLDGHIPENSPNLKEWLRFGEGAKRLLQDRSSLVFDENLALHNRLSQINVLEQLKHLETYPLVSEKLKKGEVQLHGWWFEIATATVYAYTPSQRRFVMIDEHYAASLGVPVKGNEGSNGPSFNVDM